jgi:hypothetical protein
MSQTCPYLAEVLDFIEQDLCRLQATSSPVMVPLAALRFTHHTINSNLAFGDDHEHSQESLFKLFHLLFEGSLELSDVEPLHVFLHYGPDKKVGLYSRNNRRLMAMLMLQGVRRDASMRVPCYIHSDEDTSPAPVDGQTMAQWFKRGYDGPGMRSPNNNGLGLSIWPRAKQSRTSKSRAPAKHRGYPIFNHGQAAVHAMGSLIKKAIKTDHLEAIQHVLDITRTRSIGDGEETLTLCSDDCNSVAGASDIQGSGRPHDFAVLQDVVQSEADKEWYKRIEEHGEKIVKLSADFEQFG